MTSMTPAISLAPWDKALFVSAHDEILKDSFLTLSSDESVFRRESAPPARASAALALIFFAISATAVVISFMNAET